MTSPSQPSTLTYKHVSREERYQIPALKRQGVSLGCISAELGYGPTAGVAARQCLGYRTPHQVFYGLKMQPITLPFIALFT